MDLKLAGPEGTPRGSTCFHPLPSFLFIKVWPREDQPESIAYKCFLGSGP